MKKIIFLVVLLIGMIGATQAQMLTTYGKDGQTFFKVTTDYTLTNTTPKYWQVGTQVDWPCAQTVTVHLDSLAGDHTNVALAVYGRASALTSTWTAIGSPINWKGKTADTTIIFANTTENRYREYKILFTGTGTGTTTIADMELKLHYPD